MLYWALAVPRASKKISGYETGCILYKFYDTKAMLADRELRPDLQVLVKAYAAWVESRPSVPAAGTTPLAMPAVTAPAEELAGATPWATITVTASAEGPVSALKERLIQRVRKFSPTGLKLLVGELWRRLGYQDVKVTGRPNDHAIDGDFIVPVIDVKVAF